MRLQHHRLSRHLVGARFDNIEVVTTVALTNHLRATHSRWLNWGGSRGGYAGAGTRTSVPCAGVTENMALTASSRCWSSSAAKRPERLVAARMLARCASDLGVTLSVN